jgi:DNA-directed RNA polymerase subunit F
MVAGGVSAKGQQTSNLEVIEAKAQLETSARLVNELEAKLAAEKVRTASLTQSLAAATSQATQATESYKRLRELMEGLGVGALEGSTDEVQNRLLAALKDLRLVDEQKHKVSEALVSLSESALAFAKSAQSSDPEALKKLNQALESSEAVVRAASITGTAEANPGDLHNGRVISFKEEQGVVVFNLGARDGVKVGMPFSIYREDRPIAKALVVDVRKSLCGAVVQEVINNKVPVQVGDRGKVATDRSFQ